MKNLEEDLNEKKQLKVKTERKKVEILETGKGRKKNSVRKYWNGEK